MNKFLTVLASTIAAGALVACAGPATSGESTSEGPTTSEVPTISEGTSVPTTEKPTVTANTDGEWEQAVQDSMKSVINEVLPYIELNPGFAYGTDDEIFEGGTCFYLEEDGENDFCEVYGELLVADGYTFSYTDDTYGYDSFYYVKEISETEGILVNVEFFPGTDDYSSGMSIYALIVSLLD